jgi:hypothetical protein
VSRRIGSGSDWWRAFSDPDLHLPAAGRETASSVAGEVVFNLRDVSSGGKPWTFVRQTLVRPNLLHLQVLDEKALTAQESPAALRTTLERLHDQPNAFEDLCACVRARTE